MKVGTPRWFVVAAIAALVAVGGSTTAWADCPASPNYASNFNSNSGTDCLPRNGTAAIIPSDSTPKVLRLTPDSTGHVSGTAWFNTQQPVSGGFSTTFTFQISHTGDIAPADGLAFVIQNSDVGTAARGGSGGAIGYGAPDPGEDTTNGGVAIEKSLAIEFDTYQNGWDPDANHVAVQSCGIAPNSQDHGGSCKLGLANSAQLGTTLATGTHTATVTYVPPSCSDCNGTLDVILDNKDLFPTPINVTLDTQLSLNNGSAWVGFTGSTGGQVESNDILSWTFTPQAQSDPVTTTTAAVLDFNGGTDQQAYDYNAILTAGGVTSATVTVKPILIDKAACEKLVNKNPQFGKAAQCFVYKNAGKDSGGNSVDSAVLFELTCPDQPGGTCGDTGPANFFADLGSNFTFTKAENPGYQLLAATIGPYPGWLKGSGLDPLHPCTPNPNGTTPLFQSNQISAFSVVGDPLATTKGKSGGGGSCWVATYFTGGELPPGIKVTSPKLTTYNKGTPVTAAYTCSDPKTSKPLPPASAVGPYLTAATCTQNQLPNLNNASSCSANVGGTITCTGGVDTSVKGLHAFTVKATDSGGNVNVNVVIYNVR